MQRDAIGKVVNHPDWAKKGFLLLLLFGYTGWIFYLSSLDGVNAPQLFKNADKVEHVIVFGLMASVAWLILRQWSSCQRCWLWAWVYASGYGFFDEWHQLFVPGRYSDVWDLTADAFGAALAVGLLEWRARRVARQDQGEDTIQDQGENTTDAVLYPLTSR